LINQIIIATSIPDTHLRISVLNSRGFTVQLQDSYSYSYLTSVLRSDLNTDDHFPQMPRLTAQYVLRYPPFQQSGLWGPLPEKLRLWPLMDQL